MPTGLKRYYGRGHLHFITFSCYRRLPLLRAGRAKNLFVKELSRVRREHRFGRVAHLLSFGSSRRRDRNSIPFMDVTSGFRREGALPFPGLGKGGDSALYAPKIETPRNI